MKPNLLTVVVPIYNVEEYLTECLESLQNQTIFGSLEVILVDDGSTDSSGDIARSFEANFPNVRYLRKVNGGLGAARNSGMEIATGEFITFLDSDDIVPASAYELLLAPFRNNRIDVTVGRMKTFPIESKLSWERALQYGSRRWAGIPQMPDLIHSASACNKVFRVSKIQELELEFFENVHFEDAFFVIPILMKSEVIEVIDEPVYLYRKRISGGSIMDSLFTKRKNYWDYITLIEYLREFSRSLPAEHVQFVDDFIVRGFQGFLLRANNVLSEEELPDFLRRAFAVIQEITLEVFMRSTHNAKHRIPYAMLLEMGHLGSFTSLHLSHRICLVDGTPSLSSFSNAKAASMVQTKSFTNAVESIRVVGDNIVIEGRITARGLPFNEIPDLSVAIQIGDRIFSGAWVKRYDRQRSDGIWSGFSTAIPTHRWPVGEYYPRIRLSSNAGSVTMRIFKSISLFRNFHPMELQANAIVLAINSKNQLAFTKSSNPSSGQRVHWLHALKAQFSAWRDGEPFAGLKLVRSLTSFVARRPTWIVGERKDIAQDNGAALYKYMCNNNEHNIRVRYLISKDSPKLEAMRSVGKVLIHGSIAHRFWMLHSNVLINAFDVDSYMIPSDWKKNDYVEHLLPYLDAKRVFLQHGVTFRNVASGLHRLVQGYDLIVTSSDREQRYFANELGYGSRSVLTGMPRLSTLQKSSSSTKKKLLFAPTWRTGLVTPSYQNGAKRKSSDSFEKSLYCKSILEFLQNPELASLLAENNCELQFLPHYEVADFFSDKLIGLKDVSVLNQKEVHFQSILGECDLFITDYSSTFFDVAILGTPIIHWLFDADGYDAHQEKSLFDLWEDGFGPVCNSENEVLNELRFVISSGFIRDQFYELRANMYLGNVPEDAARSTAEAIVRMTS